MNGARMTLWIILGLAELLIISLAMNIFSLRWRRRAMRESIPHPPLQLGEAIAQKAQEIEDVYRRIIGEGDEDVWSLLKNVQAKEVERLKGLEEANLKVQHDARRLEDQLSRSQDLVQQLRTKYEHLSKQYMRAFGPHNS